MFDRMAEQLEQLSSLNRLEARGTIRLALKQAGLNPGSVTSDQMKVVLHKVLAGELTSRGIDDAEALCERLAGDLDAAGLEAGAACDRPEEIFQRLGRGA
jgi:hypothetical protein